jgi:hypothetical protein
MEYNSDFRYDLKFGVVEGESWFHNIVSNSKVEVKTDRLTEKTGNVYIEYESRGKPSGIVTSQADYWVYKVSDGRAIIIEKEELKRKLRELVKNKKARMGVKGGDNNTSLGILVNIKELI